MLRSSQYSDISCVENVVSQIFVVFQCTVPSFVDVFRETFDIFSIYIVFATKYVAVLALLLNSTMIFNQKSYRCNRNKKNTEKCPKSRSKATQIGWTKTVITS